MSGLSIKQLFEPLKKYHRGMMVCVLNYNRFIATYQVGKE